MARKSQSKAEPNPRKAGSSRSEAPAEPGGDRNPPDSAHVVCQVLRTRPLKTEGKLELRWSLRGSFFPPYAIDASALVTAVDKSRDLVNAIVSTIQDDPESILAPAQAELGESSMNRQFATLAAAGFEMHNVLFPAKKDPQAEIVSKWLKGLVREDRIETLEIQIEDRCDISQDGPMPAVPWNLVYDGYVDVDELTEAFQTDAATAWARFWGVRFDLSCGQNVNPLKADHRIDPRTARAVIVMDEVISGRLLAEEPARKAFEDLLKRIEEISDPEMPVADESEACAARDSKTPVVTVLHDANDLKRYVRKNGLPNLLYWLSHAKPDALYLEFAEVDSGDRKPYQEVKLYDLEQILSIEQEENDEDSGRPRLPQRKLIAFLNGCQTSEASEQGSFLRSFSRFDQVSGLISTEQETLDAFAHQFGMKFLTAFFLERKPVGTILRDLRRETLPLGLLYGTYCPPGIRLAYPRKAAPPAPIPVAISDYLGQSLRKLSAASLAPASPRKTSELPPVSPAAAWPEKPYPSLGFYTLADQNLFAGREDDSARLALTIDSPSVRILLLHGTSGSGKSSVIRAGLIPYLEAHAVGYAFPKRRSGGPVDSEKIHLFFRPSNDFTGRLAGDLMSFTAELYALSPSPDGTPQPPVNLRPILARCVDDSKSDLTHDELKAALDDPSRNSLLCEILDALTAAIPERLVVTIDQAEEIYTLAPRDSPDQARIAERRRQKAFSLLRGCLAGSGRWKAILSYRTEYHGRITDELRTGAIATPGLADYLITDLNRERLKAVIARPTLDEVLIPGLETPRQKYGFVFEKGVIDTLVDGIFRLRGRNTDSVLPIAQVVCAQLYDEAKAGTPAGQSPATITKQMLQDVRVGAFLTEVIPDPVAIVETLETVHSQGRPKNREFEDDPRSVKTPDASAPILNILEKYADDALAEIAASGRQTGLERFSNHMGRWMPRYSRGIVARVSSRVYDLKRMMTELFHRQPDGSLTTDEISKRFAFRKYWRGTPEDFETALELATRARLLRVDSTSGSDDSEEVTIRLGHDTLGAVANRWAAADRRRELRNKFLFRSLTACLLLASCGVYMWWNNRELAQANDVAEFERNRADLAAEVMRKQRDDAESARALAMEQMHLANTLSANANVMLAQNLYEQGLHAEASTKLMLVDGKYRTFPWAMLSNQIKNAFVDFDSKLSGDIASTVSWKNGRMLAAIGNDRELSLWDDSDLRESRTPNAPGKRIQAIAISPDETVLAATHDDGSILFRDLTKRSSFFTSHEPSVKILAIAFSPDGNLLASGSTDKKIRLWDSKSGQLRATFGSHAGAVTSLAFSPAGKILASGSDDDSIRIWKFDTGKELRSLFGHRGDVNTLNFSPDGRFLASGSEDSAIILWNAATGREMRVFNGHLGGITSIAFASGSNHLISGSKDASIRIWDSATGKELRTHAGLTAAVSSLAISPNGKSMLSVAKDGTIRSWNLSSVTASRKLSGHTREVGSIAISPDGRTLASGSSDRTIRLWDIATGKETGKLTGHGDWVLTVAFTPDGKSLASGSGDFEIKIWDLLTGREKSSLLGHEDAVRNVAFSPDGKTLASASSDRTVILWDSASGNMIDTLKGHTDMVRCLAFSPDGSTLASGSLDHSIRIWDMTTHATIRTLQGHRNGVYDVAYSPDGKTLASCSADRSARLWDLATGKPIAKFSGHQDIARSVAFSPDGKVLATGGDDRTARLWDIRTLQEIRKVEFESPVYASKFVSAGPGYPPTVGTNLAIASGKSISLFDSNVDEVEDRSRRAERIARMFLAFRPLCDEALETILGNDILGDDDKARVAGIVRRLIEIEHERAVSNSIPLPDDIFGQ